MFVDHEDAPLPVYTVPYDLRKRKYACWENLSTQIGGSDTALHARDYSKTSQDEHEHDDRQEDDTTSDGWIGHSPHRGGPPLIIRRGDPSDSSADWRGSSWKASSSLRDSRGE